jgi:hypothetical protein
MGIIQDRLFFNSCFWVYEICLFYRNCLHTDSGLSNRSSLANGALPSTIPVRLAPVAKFQLPR